jgi:hypothetical protein
VEIPISGILFENVDSESMILPDGLPEGLPELTVSRISQCHWNIDLNAPQWLVYYSGEHFKIFFSLSSPAKYDFATHDVALLIFWGYPSIRSVMLYFHLYFGVIHLLVNSSIPLGLH